VGVEERVREEDRRSEKGTRNYSRRNVADRKEHYRAESNFILIYTFVGGAGFHVGVALRMRMKYR